MWISFEGIDGCGKTTQLQKLAEWLRDKGYQVECTREPGGTEIGTQIRSILLNPAHQELVPHSELLLYLADRIQHLQQKIIPLQQAGFLVLCDRFHDATVAYQGFGRQLDLRGVDSLVEQWIAPYYPDKTILLEVPPSVAQARMKHRSEGSSILTAESRIDQETRSFFERVSEGYKQLAQRFPERFIRIDADGSIDMIHQQIQINLLPLFPNRVIS